MTPAPGSPSKPNSGNPPDPQAQRLATTHRHLPPQMLRRRRRRRNPTPPRPPQQRPHRRRHRPLPQQGRKDHQPTPLLAHAQRPLHPRTQRIRNHTSTTPHQVRPLPRLALGIPPARRPQRRIPIHPQSLSRQDPAGGGVVHMQPLGPQATEHRALLLREGQAQRRPGREGHTPRKSQEDSEHPDSDRNIPRPQAGDQGEGYGGRDPCRQTI